MKIEITKSVEVKETIDVELPYYYLYDVGEDHYDDVIYRKITATHVYTIQERDYFSAMGYDDGEKNYEIKKAPRDNRDSYYFDSEYKSTKEDYEAAKSRALEFLNGL